MNGLAEVADRVYGKGSYTQEVENALNELQAQIFKTVRVEARAASTNPPFIDFTAGAEVKGVFPRQTPNPFKPIPETYHTGHLQNRVDAFDWYNNTSGIKDMRFRELVEQGPTLRQGRFFDQLDDIGKMALNKAGSVTSALLSSPELKVLGNPIIGLGLYQLEKNRNLPVNQYTSPEEKSSALAKYLGDLESLAAKRLETRTQSSDVDSWGQSITKEDIFWEMRKIAQENETRSFDSNWRKGYREPQSTPMEGSGMYFRKNEPPTPYGEPNI